MGGLNPPNPPLATPLGSAYISRLRFINIDPPTNAWSLLLY